ncbi:MAG: hypothetical protein F6K04_24110 [Leptolyngbya sp. SIO4C5]|uniref:hypothetical protein n=1 Tax=Sphaerothrix gracilis TaxID=3151835 RepID=UPI0013C1066D|nr:hypothetical protein [Leptolyngbya sp. SIO4C5]
MKSLLVKSLILPRGLAAVTVVCLLSLTALTLFQAEKVGAEERDEFPGNRQGGGTHLVEPQ